MNSHVNGHTVCTIYFLFKTSTFKVSSSSIYLCWPMCINANAQLTTLINKLLFLSSQHLCWDWKIFVVSNLASNIMFLRYNTLNKACYHPTCFCFYINIRGVVSQYWSRQLTWSLVVRRWRSQLVTGQAQQTQLQLFSFCFKATVI